MLKWWRRWDVHAGLEADGHDRWRVERLVQVQRPQGRRGPMLDVLVEWRGADSISGQAWGCEWVRVSRLTADLKAEARAMEALAYPTVLTRSTGWRRSSRLAESQTADAPRDECEDVAGAGGADDEGCSGEDDEQSTGSSEDPGT